MFMFVILVGVIDAFNFVAIISFIVLYLIFLAVIAIMIRSGEQGRSDV